MSRVLQAGLGVAFVCAVGVAAQSTDPRVPDAGGFPAPTPALERGRAVYVLNHCHFCHGTDLRRAVMGASDLLSSALVGIDRDGDQIGAVVRAGRPNLQTSMPRYDLSPQEVVDLAGYIHYLRQVGRYADLTQASLQPGDPVQGRAYFTRRCAQCHSATGDLAGAAVKYDARSLRSQIARPRAFGSDERGDAAGRAEHLRLLEQYTDADIRNLLAYLSPTTLLTAP